ncbi:hypothetical protein [Pseudomonas sp. WMBT8]|uniref:hypothetical protein n=1 Tax=Pseudomonas sp. WMBT8 TaxID=3414496 RepID=UPI003D800BFD
MPKFFIDKGNLKATAQLLFDAKRMPDVEDAISVEQVLMKRLKEEFVNSRDDFNMSACPCIYGPVYCLPATMPNEPTDHVVLNLTIRPRDAEITPWTFEAL